MRGGDAEEGDVIVLEDVPRVHVLLVFAAKVVRLVVLEKKVRAISRVVHDNDITDDLLC